MHTSFSSLLRACRNVAWIICRSVSPAVAHLVLQHLEGVNVLPRENLVEGAEPLRQLHIETSISQRSSHNPVCRSLVTGTQYLVVLRGALGSIRWRIR